MARRHARLSAKLILAAGSTLVALVSAEALTRLVGWVNDVDYSLYRTELTNPDRLPADLFTWDELTGVRLTPGAQVLATTSDFSVPYVINSGGLRDREYPLTKPSDRVRILALGDSLTFGEGVPIGQRFTDIAESSFDNLEILNAGVPGYGIDQMLIYLATEGVNYSPDYVFLFLHGVQTRRHSTRIIRSGKVVLPRAMGSRRVGAQYVAPAADDRGWLLFHSDLYAWLSYRYAVVKHRERFEKSDRRLWQRISRDVDERTDELTAKKADWERLFQRRTELLLREVVNLGVDRGFETVVVGIGEYNPLDYIGAIHPDLTFHSLTEVLRAASKRGNIRFTYDQHYNPDTHELLGTALAEVLCESHLSCDGRVATLADTADRPTGVVAAPAIRPRPAEARSSPVRDVVAATFVRRIFRGFLAHEPTPTELATWSRRIESDTANRGRLVEQILDSAEYAAAWQDQIFVISMYLGVFDRHPDVGGYSAHLAAMEGGESRKRVLRSWLSSEEWLRHFGRLDHATIAAKLCRRILRRNPTAAELDAWARRVAEGDEATVDLIVDILYRHPDHRAQNAADLLPYQLSLGMTAALPPENEYEYWAGRLRLGEPRAAVIYDYVDYH